MQISLRFSNSSNNLLIGLCEDGSLLNSAGLSAAQVQQIESWFQQGDLSGKTGTAVTLLQQEKLQRLIIVGCGDLQKLHIGNYLKIVQAAIAQAHKTAATNLDCALVSDRISTLSIAEQVRFLAQEWTKATYSTTHYKSEKKPAAKLAQISLLLNQTDQATAANQALALGQALGAGINTARRFGDEPGNVLTPKHLADQAIALAEQFRSQLTCNVLALEALQQQKMGGILAVAKGSEQPPYCIVLTYRPNAETEETKEAKKRAPVVLVGKGVTFDSGGISLKPGASMDEMKYDMCGAASVLGTLQACAQLNIAQPVIGIIPTVENMPSGSAFKPGDIVTTMSGQTVEILNTDAEGRMILCDALTYAEQFHPQVVIDVATLTGACMVALGNVVHGLFTTDEALAQTLLQCGEKSYDRAWRLPLLEDYQAQLDSNFADFANIGNGKGGATTAACFLSRFTKKYPWAHLDIAGTAWKSGSDKGATGRPVALLVEYLLALDSQQI